MKTVADNAKEYQATHFDTYLITQHKNASVSVEFSQTLCELLVEADDTSLVNLFFSEICSAVGDKGNLIPAISTLVRTFNWEDIGQTLLTALEENTEDKREWELNDSSATTMLQVVQGLEESPAQQSLIEAAVNSAVKVGGDRLCSSKILGALWRWTLLHGDKSTIDKLAEKVKGMTALQLQPVTDMFVKELGDIKATNEHVAVLASIAAIRIKWLKAKTAGSDDTAFTWEIPDAVFPDNARIQAFLRGPEQSMSTTGVRIFAGLPDARKYATRSKPINASFKMEPGGRGKDAYVTITKTREWFTKKHGEGAQYKNELRLLIDRFGDVSTEDGPAPKRARVEKSD